MSLDAGISTLIGRIYDGAHDPAIWTAAIDDLVARTQSSFVLVATLDARHLEFTSTSFHGEIDGRRQDGIREYQEELYRNDPSVHYSAANPQARHVDTRSIMGKMDYDHDPYIRWSVGALGSANWNLSYTAPIDDLVFGASIHAGPEKGTHSKTEVALFRMIFDHMEHAIRLTARPPDLAGEREAAIIIDRHGRVSAISPQAERLIARGDGLSIVDQHLRGATRAASARIDHMILSALNALAAGGAGGAVAVQRPSGQRSLALTITPLAAAHGPFAAFRASALIRIIDPDEGPPPGAAARWTMLYGLTPAEARLAETLLRGEGNLRHAADHLGIAYATARVQLASLFAKTGVGSQSQLARLLSRLGGWMVGLWTGMGSCLPSAPSIFL